MLHFRALSQSEGILDIDATVANRALNFRVAEQDPARERGRTGWGKGGAKCAGIQTA
jgi:hypothetical protein